MFNWFPWKYLVRRAARSFGVIDPATTLARIRNFAQPSEVHEPLELVRGWIIFHARGIVNTRAIQHNLDWVWPYWVHKQFNPADPSFIPRAYNLSHINLTHRNWTAVGLPELSVYPVVDPRGLVTPLYDGWSIDFWMVDSEGQRLYPSQAEDSEQSLGVNPNLEVVTTTRGNGFTLQNKCSVIARDGEPILQMRLHAKSNRPAFVAVVLRPYNTEGVQFIDKIEVLDSAAGWSVNGKTHVNFDRKPAKFICSSYDKGDVADELVDGEECFEVSCKTGMATAAATFNVDGSTPTDLTVEVPLGRELKQIGDSTSYDPEVSWRKAVEGTAEIEIPDDRMQALYDQAVRTLILLSAEEIYPGPYVYRRFWYRDACIIANAMICGGLTHHARRALKQFPSRQKASGYFHSQDGEWDSNGQVLWVYNQFEEIVGESLGDAEINALRKGMDWLLEKRLPEDGSERHGGLLPPGFSAEHLGPNDYYYWDDFWGVAGLQGTAKILRRHGDEATAKRAEEGAESFLKSIDKTIDAIPRRQSRGAIPASPYRRMDAGAVGSMVADYPLRLYPPKNERILRTADYLIDHCYQKGGFFQEMTHSGINAYLTLEIAQTMLRAGDSRYEDMVRTIADLASPTGQWPEAIHPATKGGCMGDGQHAWAAAEWLMTMRQAFVREEGDELLIGTGLFHDWVDSDAPLAYGPAPTPYGPISISIKGVTDRRFIRLEANWRDTAPRVRALLPGRKPLVIEETGKDYRLEYDDA